MPISGQKRLHQKPQINHFHSLPQTSPLRLNSKHEFFWTTSILAETAKSTSSQIVRIWIRLRSSFIERNAANLCHRTNTYQGINHGGLTQHERTLPAGLQACWQWHGRRPIYLHSSSPSRLRRWTTTNGLGRSCTTTHERQRMGTSSWVSQLSSYNM